MDIRSVLSYIGVVLEVMGVLSIIPVIFSVIFSDGMHFVFIITGIITFAFGTILDKSFKKSELDLGTAMVITALSFIIISLFGAIPYLAQIETIDAVFESVSGFTTTGLSVINIPEAMPPSLLFWRSMTQWIGGVGILIIFLLLMGSPGISSYYLYKAEGVTEKLEASVRHSVVKIFKIYGAYTIVGIGFLILAGMPLFDSINIAFTSVSTGGFAPNSASIAYYGSSIIELVVVFLMILGGTSFFVHDRVFRRQLRGKMRVVGGRFLDYMKNPETRIFWVTVGIFFVLLSVAFWGNVSEPFSAGIFLTISAITTTGFATIGLAGLEVPIFLIMIMMIIGGYAGSTAGGIKLVRAGVIAKSFGWIGRKMSFPPEAIVPFKLGKRTIKDHELSMIFLFVCVYLFVMVISGIIMIFLGYGTLDAFFTVSSAQGTVGLSTIDIAAVVWQGKILLMINMLLGRLEIFPFVVLVYSFLHIPFGKG